MFKFVCPGCGEEYEVSMSDEPPNILVKERDVERACRACGHRVQGLDAPDTCPADGCPDPERGYQPANRVVVRSFRISLCSDCQDRDLEQLMRDAL